MVSLCWHEKAVQKGLINLVVTPLLNQRRISWRWAYFSILSFMSGSILFEQEYLRLLGSGARLCLLQGLKQAYVIPLSIAVKNDQPYNWTVDSVAHFMHVGNCLCHWPISSGGRIQMHLNYEKNHTLQLRCFWKDETSIANDQCMTSTLFNAHSCLHFLINCQWHFNKGHWKLGKRWRKKMGHYCVSWHNQSYSWDSLQWMVNYVRLTSL